MSDLIGFKDFSYTRLNSYLTKRAYVLKEKTDKRLMSSAPAYATLFRWENNGAAANSLKIIEANFDLDKHEKLEKTPVFVDYTIYNSRTFNYVNGQLTELGFKYVGASTDLDADNNPIQQKLYQNGKTGVFISIYKGGKWQVEVIFSKTYYQSVKRLLKELK